jgi:hypothetical protein
MVSTKEIREEEPLFFHQIIERVTQFFHQIVQTVSQALLNVYTLLRRDE